MSKITRPLEKTSNHPIIQQDEQKGYSSRKVAANNHGDGSSHVLAEIRRSPIPPPEDLKGYQDLDPTFAKQIMEWSDLNQKAIRHRLRTEQWLSFFRSILNNSFGLAAIYFLCQVAREFLYAGAAKEGAAVICVPLAAIVAVFVTQKYYQQKSQEQHPNE